MPEENKNPEPQENKEERTISRRDFAIGSLALIGGISCPAAAENAVKLEKSDAVQDLLEERHILDEDLAAVIQHAEKTGEKLYQTDADRFLAKLRINNVYFYVEYSVIEGGYRIHTAYSHRFSLNEG